MNKKFEVLPKQSLGFFPTPVTELERLSRHLKGPRIFIKRDDLTGLAFGGNKTRKLEFLVADALKQNCDTLITAGAAQSNHCRQTAAAAAACGLDCHLALGGKAPDTLDGNLLLDNILGAKIHWTGSLRKGETIPDIAAKLSDQGKKPYVIPYGGSNAVGAAGFIEAIKELKIQLDETNTQISHIVFASSSGGTHAGMMIGNSMFAQNKIKLIGIGIDKEEAGDGPFEEHVVKLANSTCEKLNINVKYTSNDIIIRNDYLGDGYGIVGDLERRAIRLLAETEGILVDPVYTGRTMGGLIDMIEKNEFSTSDTVLFWHTGGSPAIFPYSTEIINL
ncbi:MAG: D-cysteine desulfhydrase family protein [Desulfobacteraceae bacterium]|nr:D-cysteine desulfhydrase family protein [Desulfobacteraceae bacterium]